LSGLSIVSDVEYSKNFKSVFFMLNSIIDTAIATHLAWTQRLSSLVHDPDSQTIALEEARDDTACEFGRWLKNEGAPFALFQDY
jgi:hypothetical protein